MSSTPSLPLPAVAAEMTDDMQRRALAFSEQLAERRIADAEGAASSRAPSAARACSGHARSLMTRTRDKRCAGKTKRGSGWPAP